MDSLFVFDRSDRENMYELTQKSQYLDIPKIWRSKLMELHFPHPPQSSAVKVDS